MKVTASIEFVGDSEQHLKALEHGLKHIDDVDVDLVKPKDAAEPVLVAIGIDKGGERAQVASQRIAQMLYDFLHPGGTPAPLDKKIYLVTAEGDRVDIEPLPVDEIRNIIAVAYEGEENY